MRAADTVTLTPWPLAAARRLVAGGRQHEADRAAWHPEYPLPDVVDALAMLLGAYEVDGPLADVPAWWAHEIRYRGQVVGDAGFHGPPAATGPVEVEIGYSVVPPLRGRGIATQACALLLALAWRAGADRVLAETEPDNLASRAVLFRNGFRPDGPGYAVSRPAGAPHPSPDRVARTIPEPVDGPRISSGRAGATLPEPVEGHRMSSGRAGATLPEPVEGHRA